MATKNANSGPAPGRVAGELTGDVLDVLTPWPAGTTQIELTVPVTVGSRDEAVAVAINPASDTFAAYDPGTEVVFPGESAVIDVSGFAPATLKLVVRSCGRSTAYMARRR